MEKVHGTLSLKLLVYNIILYICTSFSFYRNPSLSSKKIKAYKKTDNRSSLAGLKRTGKSCRLRWLNYLRPDVRRGNITPEEQLLIMELHAKWGNRWSKIAKHLPGRTDNEIKNFWRTRIQKHIKQEEAFSGQSSCEINEHPSTSLQASAMMETYSPSSYQESTMEAFPAETLAPDQSTDNYWSMEDLWSMQLFNGDYLINSRVN
ncbi:hypothetical protein MANES_17G113200v8 [Manihot esculenta]|uniref:Uncharacterized protein n=1 Tax=Manihot esculenta TaxID=3983 RepID=A0ACB7G644_MANES|nr:hypothetical protein MANES_17G113200v8 [Manihot esculenta]